VAPGAESETGNQDQKLGEPEDFDVCAGSGFAPILPWWLPAGQPSDKTLATMAQYPGLPCAVSWGAILIVATVLCCKAETRNLLLGNGKTLSLVSLGALVMFMALTLVGWSLT